MTTSIRMRSLVLAVMVLATTAGGLADAKPDKDRIDSISPVPKTGVGIRSEMLLRRPCAAKSSCSTLHPDASPDSSLRPLTT